jgi:arylsulfatase A-like enzyme
MKAQSKIGCIVSSVDIAPTLLELAGAPIGSHIQGRFFPGLLRGEKSGGRTSAYIEYHGDEVFEWADDADYRAIRTERHKYIH